MKIFYHIMGAMKFEANLQIFHQSLDKGRMWWYNVLGDNKGRISHILGFYLINKGSVLIALILFSLERVNYDPILT